MSGGQLFSYCVESPSTRSYPNSYLVMLWEKHFICCTCSYNQNSAPEHVQCMKEEGRLCEPARAGKKIGLGWGLTYPTRQFQYVTSFLVSL